MSDIIHEEVVQSYAKQAHKYDRRFKNYLEGSLGAALEMMRLTGKERILDVACGTGELERRILEHFPHQPICGVDVSQHMLNLAQAKLAQYPHLEFKQADSRHLPQDRGSFDLVVTCSAFHYMREPEKVLAEISRVLVPGGRFIIVDWCRDFLFGKLYHYFRSAFFPAHYDVYGLRQMKEMMLEAGLQPQNHQTFTVRFIWKMMCVEGVKL